MPSGQVSSPSKSNSNPADPKILGAFYTDAAIAEFLVWWSVRSKNDRVLDPSFGGGVFLIAAAERLASLGGSTSRQIFGVELDGKVHREVSSQLSHGGFASSENLICSNFFDYLLDPPEKVDAVVGNPPFIRYHRFTGDSRDKALFRAAEAGVTLNQLCSSWAPFLVHSTQMLRRGGRLAMVVPTEIMHASYAQPVLRFIQTAFSKLTLLTFRKKLFPELSEDTLLLLADEKEGSTETDFRIRDLEDVLSLREIQLHNGYRIASSIRINDKRFRAGTERLIEYLIPKKARDLYSELRDSELCCRFGEIADIGIGYVTGANAFFHLSVRNVIERKLHPKHLKRSVWRGRAFRGLRFTVDDWEKAITTRDAGFLLSLSYEDELDGDLANYLREGEKQGVPNGFKCRNRKNWFSVPHVYIPDGFLSYMSGGHPRLVLNNADAVAPNTLHIVRLRQGAAPGFAACTALWQTSLVRLSVEVQGHSMGGGMLKLEPTEAERVCLPRPGRVKGIAKISDELDDLLRSGNESATWKAADNAILRRLGLSVHDCAILEEAADILRGRRISRGGKNGSAGRDPHGGGPEPRVNARGEEALVGDSLETPRP